ncbi:hypothetical protein ACTWP4_06435 [Gracilibacillus sp. D59]|uniref:hypothetical protein n=1 Tax=Gracilibacillus sp. D59 TaxID=3457434 RepID=UPI003FCD7744
MKAALGLRGNKRRYSEKELINIAKEHKKHFTSKRNWIEYALENNLLTDIVYINHFEFWNNAKKVIDIPITKGTNTKKYKKEDIEKNHRQIATDV